MSRATIVIPCFDEAARLDLEAFESFARKHSDLGFVLVDDGSRDATPRLLEALRERLPTSFDLLRLERNRGKAEAVRRGVLHGLDRAPYVGYWDADLATPLEAIPDFCEVLDRSEAVEFVFGARVQLLGRRIQRRALRHYVGRIFATVVSTSLGLPIYDTQCGAKLFRATPRLRTLFAEPFRTSWIFDVEILARLLATRSPDEAPPERIIHELPLQEWRDVAGSKLRAADWIKAIWEMFQIHRTYLAPLRRRR